MRLIVSTLMLIFLSSCASPPPENLRLEIDELEKQVNLLKQKVSVLEEQDILFGNFLVIWAELEGEKGRR